jgi:hypothetical protein
MVQKYLDIQYIRSLNTPQGRLALSGSSNTVTFTNFVNVDLAGNVGIGTATSPEKLTVQGNVLVQGSAVGFHFADGTIQTTAATSAVPGGTSGEIQYNTGGHFDASNQLVWDNAHARLGIGTSAPLTTIHFKQIMLESTYTVVSNTATTVIDSFPVPVMRSAHYYIQVTDDDNSWFHLSQITMVHDGLTAFSSEYNVVTTHFPLGTFNTVIVLGQVQLVFTPLYVSKKEIKVARTSITV